MKRIGLLSDTHGVFNPAIAVFFKDCDEVWHAGDIGNIKVAEDISSLKPLKAVYGNIDGTDVRAVFRNILVFQCEGVKVLMTHIGGYPGHYRQAIKELLLHEKPGLFICGHSHILRIIYDKTLDCLHINPGAAGNTGIHKLITAVRFIIDKDQIRELDIFQVPRKQG